MNVTVKSDTLARDAELLKRAQEKVRNTLSQVVRRVSLQTMTQIKRAMPVDTGRARASWGQWGGAAFSSVARRARKGKLTRAQATNYAAASAADSVWKIENDGLKVTQGSNLPYIEVLNAGHSEQAPRGFIDVAAAEAEAALIKEVDAAVDAMWAATVPAKAPAK